MSEPSTPPETSAAPASAIRWERDADGVVTLTLDDPAASANTMNDAYVAAMGAAVDRLEAERDDITGVVVTSAKTTFFAGGDLDRLSRVTDADAPALLARLTEVKSQLRRLETLGRPVAAALTGSALGGGLEIALACHHRVAVDDPKARFGFPEVTLGLLPGAGGVTRSVRMLGLADALTKLLLEGQQLRPAQAVETGIVDALAPTRDEAVAAARAWVAANPDAAQPWDRPGHRIPGGTPSTPKLAAVLPAFPANLRKQTKGAPMPAPHHILCAAVEGAQVDLDTALRVESRYFVDLARGQVSTNMIQAFWYDLNHVNGGGSRPSGYGTRPATTVAVLGAGMMGAGIAYVTARAGVDVVLKDVSAEVAERGKAYSARLLDKAVAKGRTTPEQRDAVLARITPTGDVADLAGCDLVVEAVSENTALKHRVFGEVEPVVAADALLGSNTSTLPITGLAEGVRRRSDFVGLHFFSPVDRMPLLEIVRGEQTSDEALARAFDYARQIRKTPIVVHDSRGFFTSRVIATFAYEATAMLAEGVPPATVEQAALQAGYPVGPLQLLDELNLALLARIRTETREAVEAAGGTYVPHPGEVVLDRMVALDRTGRLRGAGFYDYGEDGARRGLWDGLATEWPPVEDPGALDLHALSERMLVVEAVESVRCLEEGVLTSVPDANVGSILGIGYPAWTGGVLQYVDQFDGGTAGFCARAEVLAKEHGARFAPPALLRAKAERGETFA